MVEVTTATHQSAARRTTWIKRPGVRETSVRHGTTGVDEAYLPVRFSVTRRPADAYATPNNSRCRHGQEDGYHKGGRSQGTSGVNGPYKCTPMRTPTIGDRAAGYDVNSSSSMGSPPLSRPMTKSIRTTYVDGPRACPFSVAAEREGSKYHKFNISMSQGWQWCRTTKSTLQGQWCPM